MSDLNINIIEVIEVPVSLDPDKPATMKLKALHSNLSPVVFPRISPGSFFTHEKKLYRVLRVDFNFDTKKQLIFISLNFTSQIAAGPGKDGQIIFYNLTLHSNRWRSNFN